MIDQDIAYDSTRGKNFRLKERASRGRAWRVHVGPIKPSFSLKGTEKVHDWYRRVRQTFDSWRFLGHARKRNPLGKTHPASGPFLVYNRVWAALMRLGSGAVFVDRLKRNQLVNGASRVSESIWLRLANR